MNRLPSAETAEFKEVIAGEGTLNETDWDSYIEGYNYSAGEHYFDDDERPSYENILTKKGTLSDHLMWQLNLTRLSDLETRVGAEIIGNIDEDGYFRASLADVATACQVDEQFVEAVLKRIQEFDPVGVGGQGPARDLIAPGALSRHGRQPGRIDSEEPSERS